VRVNVLIAVGGAQHRGLLVDVSEGGAQIASDFSLAPGTEVRVTLEARRGRPAVQFGGRVIWSSPSRFAIELSDVSAAAKQWLDGMLGAEQTSTR